MEYLGKGVPWKGSTLEGSEWSTLEGSTLEGSEWSTLEREYLGRE